jgi:NhaP-type Na+/H+ or K+/H+ antiporter
VLALGVALSLLTVALAATFNGRQLSPEEVTAISTIFGATVGAVATYLGGRAGAFRSEREHDDDEPDDDGGTDA